MRLIFTFILFSFIGNGQINNSVIITPVTDIELDSTSSYIYCATMDIMWNKFNQHLGEEPQTYIQNSTIELLNKVVDENYQVPIEDKYIVANSGLVKDSIIQTINSELQHKFGIQWNFPNGLSDYALISYSYLKKDVKFYYDLDDHFYDQSFNNKVNVDYFGIKEGDPKHNLKNILIHDYKNSDDFIVQLNCKDSLDEIYFAKIPSESNLFDTYNSVLNRLKLKNVEIFNGGDILKIPYIKFDTTANYREIEGVKFKNSLIDGKSFQQISQRINFDLNPQGIKLESIVESIIDFADFENPPPRILAFNKPFLIIMKRKGFENPYFMYWVSGTEFMRSYILKTRVTDYYESTLVGKWQLTKMISKDNKESNYNDGFSVEISFTLNPDGTCEIIRANNNQKGTWRYVKNVIYINPLDSYLGTDKELIWVLDEISKKQFTVGGETKLIFEKDEK